MELLIGLALILAFNEWRDYKFNRKHQLIEKRILKISRQLHYVGDLAEKILAVRGELSALRRDIEPLHEFIAKAHTNLETIVKEYDVNGVPLGYERQNYDAIEGL